MADAMVWTLGFMSGTSMDGVDAALLLGDGERIAALGPRLFRAFQPHERAALAAAARRAAADARAEAFAAEAAMLADAHAEAAEALLAQPGAPRPSLVGFHGQTLLHRPAERLSLQIGDAERLAARLSLPVAHDFRSADVAAGGQGAPLAPFFHHALARFLGVAGVSAWQNLGGVGNVTFVDAAAADPTAPGALLAFDTGPANAPMDDLMRARLGRDCDVDGALAGAGRVDAGRLRAWIARADFLRRPPPKSLDREDFAWLQRELDGVATEDALATLGAFIGETIAAAARFAPAPPTAWVALGGGRKNTTLLRSTSAALGRTIAPVEALSADVDGDFVEAYAFAHLALRVRRGLALSSPSTTGAPRPMLGGRIATPPQRR